MDDDAVYRIREYAIASQGQAMLVAAIDRGYPMLSDMRMGCDHTDACRTYPSLMTVKFFAAFAQRFFVPVIRRVVAVLILALFLPDRILLAGEIDRWQ